jgi:guanine deaminase
VASVFCDTLLRNGTTTACVYCAVYPQSVDALFAAAAQRRMRMIAGKCMMDRNVPQALRDTAKTGYESKALIGMARERTALYAITPRWAGSSTPAQLEAAGALWREHPELHVQTHIALFVLMTLGDDRGVRATFVAGQLAHRRQPVDA